MDRLLSILVMNEGNLDRCLSGQTPKSIHKETNNTRLKDGVTNNNTDSPILQAFLLTWKTKKKPEIIEVSSL